MSLVIFLGAIMNFGCSCTKSCKLLHKFEHFEYLSDFLYFNDILEDFSSNFLFLHVFTSTLHSA